MIEDENVRTVEETTKMSDFVAGLKKKGGIDN